MSRWQTWCPPGALIDGKLMSAIGEVFQVWMSHWIDLPVKSEVRLALGGSGFRAGPDVQVFGQGGGLALVTTQKKRNALAARVIGLSAPGRSLPAADASLFDELSAHCLSDLAGRVAALCGGSEAASIMDASDLTCEVGVGSLRLEMQGLPGCGIDIWLSQDYAARLRLSLAPRPEAGAPLMAAFLAASDEVIPLSAHLGIGELSFTDLAAMEPGDIILLDRSIGDRAGLAIAGEVVLADCLELAGTSDGLHLRYANR